LTSGGGRRVRSGGGSVPCPGLCILRA
jgi:hypothetical protein